jgi:hypothetical protein
MLILFKPDINIKNLRQTPFLLFIKDYTNINIILNLLKKAGVIEDVPLGQLSLITSPAFIVYRNVLNSDLIPRYVVDLRQINIKIYINIYLLPKQNNILITIGSLIVFSILNITKSFF